MDIYCFTKCFCGLFSFVVIIGYSKLCFRYLGQVANIFIGSTINDWE